MASLNDAQLAFCREYVVLNNATKAAKRAGYAEKSAYLQGCRLLKHDKIVAEIQRLRALHAARLDITVDEITHKLIEDRDLAHEKGQAGAAVSASSALAKLHGLIVDKREVRHVVADLTDEELEAELAEVRRELEQMDDETRH